MEPNSTPTLAQLGLDKKTSMIAQQLAAVPTPTRDLTRDDVEAELTKILRHGYGVLVVKIHGHQITCLESLTRHTKIMCTGETNEEAASSRPVETI